MADIYCKCGEPWDLDSLHDHISENISRAEWTKDGTVDGPYDDAKYSKLFQKARIEFGRVGCEMFGTSHSNANPRAGELQALADEIMGDDVDGAIAMMEDADAMGLLTVQDD